MNPDRSERQVLADARQRARKLLDDLMRQQAELDASPPALDAQRLAAGRAALQGAIDSSRRMLQSIEKALACDPDPCR